MEPIITYENLRSFAYSNDALCEQPIRGLVIEFYGLGNQTMLAEDSESARDYARRGILYLIPYGNPWAWMNRAQVRLTDQLVDVQFRHYDLPERLPIVSTGGSMGGQQSIAYTAYAGRTPVACVANCPVCDMPYHYTERPDLPRTMLSAFGDYEGTMEEALRTVSPVHLAQQLPPIPYHIFHCEEDRAVNIARHSEVFVDRMKQAGADITLDRVPGRGHCDLTPEAAALYRRYILKAIAGNET